MVVLIGSKAQVCGEGELLVVVGNWAGMQEVGKREEQDVSIELGGAREGKVDIGSHTQEECIRAAVGFEEGKVSVHY